MEGWRQSTISGLVDVFICSGSELEEPIKYKQERDPVHTHSRLEWDVDL